MNILLINFINALLGFSLPEPFIVLIVGVGIVTMASIARRRLTKMTAKTSRKVQTSLQIHTSQVGKETT